jgi:hypothetical protein
LIEKVIINMWWSLGESDKRLRCVYLKSGLRDWISPCFSLMLCSQPDEILKNSKSMMFLKLQMEICTWSRMIESGGMITQKLRKCE